MWEAEKTNVGTLEPPNKTFVGYTKTFVGSRAGRGAARRRSRCAAAAGVLTNAKRAKGA